MSAPQSAPPGPAASPAPGASVSEASGLRSQPSGFSPQASGLSPQPSSSGLLPPHFAEAWINDEHRVCRVRLPAYSLHAHLMLCAVQSPFAFETLPAGYQITWEDLWEAITAVTTAPGRAVRYPPAWLCVFRQRWHRLDLAREVAAFRRWQNDYLSAPEVFCTEGDGRELTAPGILARVVFLARHLTLSPGEIWTMPIGQALWLHAATLEQVNENVSLLEDEEAKLFALIKRIQDGTADPSELPGRPDESARDGLLARAAARMGLDRTPTA